MMFSTAVVIMTFFLLLLLLLFFGHRRRGLPPGPTPLPLVGNILSLRLGDGELPGGVFAKWRRQYGGLYTFWLGHRPTVYVTEHAKMVEIFSPRNGDGGDCCEERSNFCGAFEVLSGGNYGLAYAKGDQWEEQRRFLTQKLRDFGMGKSIMEERILGEVTDLMKRLERETPEVDVQSQVDLSVGNMVTQFMFSFRFDEANAGEFVALKSATRLFLATLGCPSGVLAVIYPRTVGRLPYFCNFYERFLTTGRTLYAFIDAQIEKHMLAFSAVDDMSIDYVQAFFGEAERRDAAGEQGHRFTVAQLRTMCFELWLAGQETTSNTIAWGIAYLLHHPAVRERLSEELDRVIADGRLVRMSDRPSLPYTRAVISEIQRCANVVPIAIPRLTSREIQTSEGYRIPKGTPVMAQISTVLHDEEIFKDPLSFKPERFLTSGDHEAWHYRARREFVPFSVGKRKCVGEALATMELFLIIANLFKRYEVGIQLEPHKGVSSNREANYLRSSALQARR